MLLSCDASLYGGDGTACTITSNGDEKPVVYYVGVAKMNEFHNKDIICLQRHY